LLGVLLLAVMLLGVMLLLGGLLLELLLDITRNDYLKDINCLITKKSNRIYSM